MKLLLPALLGLSLPGVAANDVIVVSATPGPGVDFTAIAPAVAAASSGDVVLVRAGIYILPPAPVLVDGKGLTLVADGVVLAVGSLEVRNLPAGETFALRNFSGIDAIDSPLTVFGSANAGAVWVEDCGLGADFVAPPVHFTNSSTVVFQRNLAFGADVRLTSSALHAFGGELIGLSTTGLRLVDSFGYAAGVEIDGSLGLPDLQLIGASQAFLLDSVADVTTGNVTVLPGVARTLEADALVVEGGTLNLTVRGQPGDTIFVLVSRSAAGIYVPAVSGSLTVAPLLTATVPFGTVPATGILAASVPMPLLPPGVEARVHFAQVLALPSTGGAFLGGGSMVTVLDAGI